MLRKWTLSLICCLATLNSFAATVDVDIQNFLFEPDPVTIKVGDTVRWRQRDGTPHTTTSTQGEWDSGFLNAGQTFSHIFRRAGSFPYFCEPHPWMTGTVIVEAAAATAPTVAITSPSQNATLTPGPVTITATAEVTGSTITRVEFYNGAALLGSDTTSPYSFEANLSAGSHTLTARAFTAADGTATSSPVTVTVTPGGVEIPNPIVPRIAMSDTTIELQVVVDGLAAPLGMAVPDDNSGRIFVYDQIGLIHVLTNGTRVGTPALDVGPRMVPIRANYDERGLLGLALHPNFAQNPLVYTYTSEPNGPMADFMIHGAAANDHQSVVAEWRLDPGNTNRVDPASRREILRIDQPQFNHNGGVMHFGRDGYLYIALGDGGDADDQGSGHSPGGNAQDTNNVLGKILRIDVNGRTSPNGQYSIPTDNPFFGKGGVEEIYALGFRNPFGWSFDMRTGEMWVGDVGQNDIEELDLVFAGGNYGWPAKEGSFYFDQNGAGNGFVTTMPVLSIPPNVVDPIAQYDHDDGKSIIGGYVYYGSALPNLLGRYIGGELGLPGPGRLFYLDRTEFKEFRIGLDNRGLGMFLKGFGQDAAGEVYVFASTNIGPSGATGKMFKIVPAITQLALTDIAVSGGSVTLAWENGAGPYAVQAKSRLVDSVWRTIAVAPQPTATFPAGEAAEFIRILDLAGNAPVGFTAHMTGAAERPAVSTPAMGSGTFSLEGNTLHFDIRYTGLKALPDRAHIHGPAGASNSAGILIDLGSFNGGAWGTNGVLSGSVTITNAQHKAWILEGKTYVNVHTAAHGSGEIRGQLAPVLWVAELTGAAERPAVQSPGYGIGVFMLVTNHLTFNVSYRHLSSTAVNAHIHGPASRDVSGGVRVHLSEFNGGAWGTNGTLNGSVKLGDEDLAMLLDNLAYVNIHSQLIGSGELRGQILPKTTAVALSSALSGAAERPTPVSTPGGGTGLLALEGNLLHFSVNYDNLKADANNAHIHGIADTESPAGVLVNLVPSNGGAFGRNGTLAGTVALSAAHRAAILEGRTYINIHSVGEHASGEIRGQIAPVVLHASLLGATERPASVETKGSGRGTLLLVGTNLTMNVTYGGLSSSANNGHIHGPATTSGSTNVMVNLAPINGGAWATNGSLSGTVSLTPAQLGALIDERTYINIHSVQKPGGEIRGQILK